MSRRIGAAGRREGDGPAAQYGGIFLQSFRGRGMDGWSQASRTHVDGTLALMDCSKHYSWCYSIITGRSSTLMVKQRFHTTMKLPENNPFKLGHFFFPSKFGMSAKHSGVGGKHIRGPWNFGDRLLICSPADPGQCIPNKYLSTFQSSSAHRPKSMNLVDIVPDSHSKRTLHTPPYIACVMKTFLERTYPII